MSATDDLVEALSAASRLIEQGEPLPRHLELALLRFRRSRLVRTRSVRQEEPLLGLAAPDQAGELLAPGPGPH
jgi:hypothetical protein